MFREIEAVLTHEMTVPLVLIAILILIVFLLLHQMRPEKKPREPKFSRNPALNGLAWVAVPLSPVGALVFLAALLELAMLAWRFPTPETPASDLRWHSSLMLATLAAIGALFGLVLAFIRVFTTERQTRAAEEGLITDRITKAVAGLGADKAERNYGKPTEGADYQQFERTVPNLEVRIGSVYALERIAQDSDRDHVQIMEILCAYVRQNAPASLAQPFPEDWEKAFAAQSDAPGVTRPDGNAIRDWARGLAKPREDVQVALNVLGRRSPRQIALEGHMDAEGTWQGYRPDLRETCLQRADMARGQFDHARLDRARMQGADLAAARMQEADLAAAQMQGADLAGAQMQGADLLGAQMQGAKLGGAQMQGIKLFQTQMDAATDLASADLSGAALMWADLAAVSMTQAQLDSTFGDASVTLPAGASRPAHWLGTQAEWPDFVRRWRAWQKARGPAGAVG